MPPQNTLVSTLPLAESDDQEAVGCWTDRHTHGPNVDRFSFNRHMSPNIWPVRTRLNGESFTLPMCEGYLKCYLFINTIHLTAFFLLSNDTTYTSVFRPWLHSVIASTLIITGNNIKKQNVNAV